MGSEAIGNLLMYAKIFKNMSFKRLTSLDGYGIIFKLCNRVEV